MKWVISVCHQNMWCGNLTSTLCSVDVCMESGVAYLFNSVSSPKNMTFGVTKTVRNVNRYVYLCSFKFPCKKMPKLWIWLCKCTYMYVHDGVHHTRSIKKQLSTFMLLSDFFHFFSWTCMFGVIRTFFHSYKMRYIASLSCKWLFQLQFSIFHVSSLLGDNWWSANTDKLPHLHY